MADHQPEQARFRERERCIACDGAELTVLDQGLFSEEPHRSSILNSPWGESPYPFLENCRWVLVECAGCGQIFHRRILTPEWDERRFNSWMTAEAVEKFEKDRGARTPEAIFRKSRQDLERLLSLEKITRPIRKQGEELRLLDYGCGWGGFISLGALLGFRTYGIDRHEARRNDNKATRVFADLDSFRAQVTQPLHAVSLLQVLEHLPAPMEILRAARELLLPGGILILEVPDCSGVRDIKSAKGLIVSGIDHINAFTPATLRGIAGQAGFHPVRRPIPQVTADFPRVVKREAKRLLSPFRGPTTEEFFRRS